MARADRGHGLISRVALLPEPDLAWLGKRRETMSPGCTPYCAIDPSAESRNETTELTSLISMITAWAITPGTCGLVT